MTVYRTCTNCAHDRSECATLDGIRRAIAGHHITSVKFRCENRAPIFRAGDRVTVTWLINSEIDDYYPGDWGPETWPATVVSEAGSKFVILVDDVPSSHDTLARDFIKSANLYCKVSASKLEKLDEPQRRVCGLCGIVGTSDFKDCGQTGAKPDEKCLRAIVEAAA